MAENGAEKNPRGLPPTAVCWRHGEAHKSMFFPCTFCRTSGKRCAVFATAAITMMQPLHVQAAYGISVSLVALPDLACFTITVITATKKYHH